MSPPTTPSASAPPSNFDVSNLPSVPSDLPDVPEGNDGKDDDDIDFDYLSKRFEELKKKK